MSGFGGSTLPGQYTRTRASRLVRYGTFGKELDGAVVIDSAQTDSDSGHTPTYEFRSGNVVVLRTSTGKYVAANDANGDRCTPPVLTSLIPADSTWASKVITLKRKGATIVAVTLGGADDTTSEVVTALNGNAVFKANALASGADGASLVITGYQGGADAELEVSMNLTTAWTTINGSNSEAQAVGADADYRVLLDTCYLVSPVDTGTAADGDALAARLGRFYTTNLINLTGQAKAVLTRRGSTFE